jgi:hypothetical integral membrane protein (TIGR02206 family)
VERADGSLLGHMTPYGTQHLAVLAVVAVATVLCVRAARRAARSPEGSLRLRRILRTAGWALLSNSVAWTLWGFTPGTWSIEESLPLHFSDALRFLGPIALITTARWAVVISYFWGLTLNLQSVLTPDVNYFVWPPLEFAEYWIAHGAGVLIPLALVWGLGLHPTWRGFALAYAATLAWAGLAFAVNTATGANYAYLSHAPAGPSLLDVMGPWPLYILVEAAAVALVWALITLPWVRADGRSGAPVDGRGALVRRRPDPAPRPLDTVLG